MPGAPWDQGATRPCAASANRVQQRGLPLGLPMTVKEQFDVAGLPTTWAQRFRDWRPDVDALAMQRLKGAGAMFICEINIR